MRIFHWRTARRNPSSLNSYSMKANFSTERYRSCGRAVAVSSTAPTTGSSAGRSLRWIYANSQTRGIHSSRVAKRNAEAVASSTRCSKTSRAASSSPPRKTRPNMCPSQNNLRRWNFPLGRWRMLNPSWQFQYKFETNLNQWYRWWSR